MENNERSGSRVVLTSFYKTPCLFLFYRRFAVWAEIKKEQTENSLKRSWEIKQLSMGFADPFGALNEIS